MFPPPGKIPVEDPDNSVNQRYFASGLICSRHDPELVHQARN